MRKVSYKDEGRGYRLCGSGTFLNFSVPDLWRRGDAWKGLPGQERAWEMRFYPTSSKVSQYVTQTSYTVGETQVPMENGDRFLTPMASPNSFWSFSFPGQ